MGASALLRVVVLVVDPQGRTIWWSNGSPPSRVLRAALLLLRLALAGYVRAVGRDLDPSQTTTTDQHLIAKGPQDNSEVVAPWPELMEFFQNLGATTYVPAFRNAINVGTADAYFDIQAGQSFIQDWRQLKTGNAKASTEAILRLTRLSSNCCEDTARTIRFFCTARRQLWD